MNHPGEIELGLLGNQLHQRLLAGDVTASAEIAETYLQVITRALRKQYPNLYDPHLAESAAEDALISYLQRPSQYDPSQLHLDKYLVMSARGDLLHLLHKPPYRGYPQQITVVELDAREGEHHTEIEDDSLTVEDQVAILISPVWPMLESLLPSTADREIALMMLEGVRDTTEYATVLGLGDLSPEARESEVKRQKDRIKKNLKRHIDRTKLDKTL